jgi:predicted ATPase
MKIILTGGPCGGKSTIVDLLKEHGITCHDEVATQVISHLGLPKTITSSWRLKLQKEIFSLQEEIETKSPIGVFDRGMLDGAAYFSSIDEFETIFKTKKSQLLGRYDAVFHLQTLAYNEKKYNKLKHNNPNRAETAEQAVEADRKVYKVWEGHPNHYILKGNIETNFKTILQYMKR